MIYWNIKQLLCSFLLLGLGLLCVDDGFASPTVDNQRSSRGLGPSRHLDLGSTQNAPRFMESSQVLFYPRHPDGAGNIKHSSDSLVDMESQSTELSKIFNLFAKRSDATVSTSSVNSLTTPKTFLTKEEALKPQWSESTSYTSGVSSFNSNLGSNKPLSVPSEGGLMQDSTVTAMSAETKNVTEMDRLLAGYSHEELEVKGIESGLSTEDTLGLHHDDISVDLIKKQVTPPYSHISARKGATLGLTVPEKSEVTSSSISDITEQLTFPRPSSESSFTKEIHLQKIAPRKGAMLPKIIPRKGVEDKIDNQNSSDTIFSEENNGPTTISIETVSTPSAHHPLLNKSAVSLSDNVKDGRSSNDTSTAKLFQSRPTTKIDSSLNVSTHSTSSKSLLISPVSKSPMPKLDTASGIGVKNIYSNLTVSLSDMKNDTEDKSGIIASYPPLRKRLKPLKTTDTSNSSPSPPEHISSEHDYIVPIVVSILSIPMLVVLMLFLYKKGSEFWERRHYRRMDFLIDGMYND